ncbi:hypothetical protein CASFOL_006026 [Castilleja foliolosa]|uniref:Inactive poly [ADP-ribose] polymerase RCD1-like n=1 Tax=Castilleja foliolosa TaxID=1961234 RepID=A0ABD3E5I4_9LAMI
MNAVSAKVLDNGRAVVNLKRKQSDRGGTFTSAGAIPVLLPQQSSPASVVRNISKKRRKLEGSKSKYASCGYPSGKCLLKYYSNLKRSGILQRLMYYQNDEWNDFSQDIVTTVNKDFIVKKSAVEVEVNGSMILLDFLQMILLDMDNGLHQPIAWIDVSGKCFFPEIFWRYEEPLGVEGHNHLGSETQDPNAIKLNLEIEIQKLNDESCGESVPIVVNVQAQGTAAAEDCGGEVDSGAKISEVEVDENHEDIQLLEGNMIQTPNSVDGSLNSYAVRELFFRAINSSAAEIVQIRPCTSIIKKGRLELFQKQVEITKRYRGDANVKYAWLPCSSRSVSALLKYGIGYHDQLLLNPSHGNGIHLIPTNGTQISLSCFDVDENDTRHMVLCCVIMGNVEPLRCGSDQFLPNSEEFDSGVDRLENPNLYVVWNMNMNSHIYAECVVSFRATSVVEGMALGESVEAKTPKSAWMPFPLLFAAIADKVTSESMDLVRTNYALFKNKKMSRDEFVKNLRLIVGDNLLKSAIISLQRKNLSSSNVEADCSGSISATDNVQVQ